VNEPDPVLNKAAQLLVVVVGFFTAVALLASRGDLADWSDAARRAITLAFAIGLAVRYWWVILLLEWPFRLGRTALLLLAWSALAAVAAGTGHARPWAFALAALSAVGAATEAYNAATGQWRVRSPALAESLPRDHCNGLVAAALGAVALLGAGAWLPPAPLTAAVGLMALADWGRLIEMIARHRRLMTIPGEDAR